MTVRQGRHVSIAIVPIRVSVSTSAVPMPFVRRLVTKPHVSVPRGPESSTRLIRLVFLQIWTCPVSVVFETPTVLSDCRVETGNVGVR